MMMVPVSEALKDLLCRQGMSAGSAGTDDALEIDAGEPGKLNPAIGRREGGQTGPMGMKRTPGEPAPVNRGKRQTQPVRKSAGFDYVVHLNHAADNMPARKTTKRNTSVAFLTCMDGGRK